ncbi:MAG: hypothetical protein A3E01_08465 [Gammaproteobacteria bacterium RIFCSPHIGHO2_12_FULL_63_22]|nr:MAG: hypothetical protein A3E01_08465 [Gammaproteobacteria bacterium RIFCSPHIGHO2_12_FULL_63_22]
MMAAMAAGVFASLVKRKPEAKGMTSMPLAPVIPLFGKKRSRNLARERRNFEHYILHGFKGETPPKVRAGYFWKRAINGRRWRLYKTPAGDPGARVVNHPTEPELVIVYSAHGYLKPVVKHRDQLRHERNLIWQA